MSGKLEAAAKSLQRLCKWRTVFTGWQLGTRTKTDPEGNAVNDHRELTMLMRVELTAAVRMMIEKKICTAEEFTLMMGEEAEYLMKAYEQRFPGCKADDNGLILDPQVWANTVKGWRP